MTSEVKGDEVDGGQFWGGVYPLRTKAVKEQYLAKIAKLSEQIRLETSIRDGLHPFSLLST